MRTGVGDAVAVGLGDGVGVGVEVGLVLREGAGVQLGVDVPVVELPEQPTMARATSRPVRPRLVVRDPSGRRCGAEPMPLPARATCWVGHCPSRAPEHGFGAQRSLDPEFMPR